MQSKIRGHIRTCRYGRGDGDGGATSVSSYRIAVQPRTPSICKPVLRNFVRRHGSAAMKVSAVEV